MALMQSFKSQMLWDNIEKGDLSAVVNLLQNGDINLEERDQTGQTFLMAACRAGDVSIVRELLDTGIDPNGVDNDNWSALMFAAKNGALEISIELLERGASLEHRDMFGWTPLMWASYKGHEIVVQEYLERGADANVKAEYNMSCLAWAAGRGHLEVVKALLQKGARVNSPDKFGTTPLIWASRKGYTEIAKELLDEGAHVDVTGMDSLTALLVAVKGGYSEVVTAVLEHEPNVNAVDKDGFTALTIAAKEGYTDICQELLAKDAYVNIADRVGDTILIHAVKGGYVDIVRALLNRYADLDVQGQEGKTALYWAVEKGHTDIVQLLLDNDPDIEISNKDGDTPLMRAVRNRHELCVRLLLDKKARVGVCDKKGDTALHISLRARSKRITELLLRNPRNSRLLYRPNKDGETPYSIDAYHQKQILAQIHGHRQLNASDGENLLGYEIYGSALADILSDPTLNTPIVVGLYAKWGSGKSFLLGKLKDEMLSFTQANMEDSLEFTWSLFITLLIVNCFIGSVLALAVMWEVGIGVGFGLFLLEYGFLGLIWLCSTRYNIRFSIRISQAMGKRLQIISLLLQVLFCNPRMRSSATDVPLVKFLFSESTRLSSVGGEKALAHMVASLSEAVEGEFGFLASRLFGLFKPSSEKPYAGRFKTVCCIPVFAIVVFLIACFITGIALLVTYKISDEYVNGVMIALGGILVFAFMMNINNIGKAIVYLVISQKARVMRAADHFHHLKMEGLLQSLKHEVNLMNRQVTNMDKYTKNTTRLVVIVDGLDSCEQEKVLQVLDIIHTLFNEENSSFVTILAVDPQIIIKGINQNLKSPFHDTNVNGFDYLRNIVHLPFYLQSQGIQVKKQALMKTGSTFEINRPDSPGTLRSSYRHQDSTVSQISGFSVADLSMKKRNRGGESVTQIQSSFDLTNTVTKNDYFSDINPRTMRRFMNIVAVTGRLLRAYNIDFNWYRLASWVNIIEQWPYRMSWVILHFEEHEGLADDVTLKFLYQKIEPEIPVSSDIDPLLEIDRNPRKLDAFLSSKSPSNPMLNIGDLKKFLPCTINLDPYLRKLIRNFQKTMNLASDFGGTLYSGGPQPHPPNRDTEHQFSQMRTNINQTPLKPPMAGMPYGHMAPYGSHGRGSPMVPMQHPPPMMPMQQAAMMGMSPYLMGMGPYGYPLSGGLASEVVLPQTGKKTQPPGHYIRGFKDEILSKLATHEVASILSRIDGLNLHQIPTYQQNIEENNINGMVLSQCELDELGKVMGMKFGDWQLFRTVILSLREAEESGLQQSEAVEDEVDSGTGAQRTRTNSVLSGKSIHFQEPERSGSAVFEPEASSSRVSYNPQVSVEPQRLDNAEPAAGGFETIHEDSETSIPSQENLLKRNDSVVAELMYESGLLHQVMQSFAEEDESHTEEELDDEESEEKDGRKDEEEDEDTSEEKPSSKKRGLPVQFTLSSQRDGASPDRNLDEDNVNQNAYDHDDSEFDPLLDIRKSDLEIHLPEETVSGSPKPILKKTRNYNATGSQISLTDGHFRSDLDMAGSEPDLSFRRPVKSPELLHTERSYSLSSTGFTALNDHQRPSLVSGRGNSVDFVDVINETSSQKQSPGSRSSSERSSLQKVHVMSIEDSIRQFTMSQASSQSAGERSPPFGARSPLLDEYSGTSSTISSFKLSSDGSPSYEEGDVVFKRMGKPSNSESFV